MASRQRALGWVLFGLAAAFLAFDSVGKLARLAPVVQGTTALGYDAGSILPIGIIELVCLVVLLVPRTSPLGAVLLTGYLGGAVATHVRIGSPLLTHVLFPVYVAALVWGGLLLIDPRVRHIVADRR